MSNIKDGIIFIGMAALFLVATIYGLIVTTSLLLIISGLFIITFAIVLIVCYGTFGLAALKQLFRSKKV